MKTVGNIISFIALVLVFSYIAFLTVVPMMLEKKIDAAVLRKNIFDATQLKAEFLKPKVYTTSSLGIGLKLKEVNIMYPDDKEFFKAGKVELEVAALPLLFKTIKFNKISATGSDIDLLILESKEYKINDFLEAYFPADFLTRKYPELSKYSFEFSPLTLNSYSITMANLATNKFDKFTGSEKVVSKFTVTNYIKPYFENKDKKMLINIK